MPEIDLNSLDKYLYKHCTIPKNDNRNYPRGSAGAPMDFDGYHWKDGDPQNPGWYAVALFDSEYCGCNGISLPVERAYFNGNNWSRRHGKRNGSCGNSTRTKG